ncbi:MAG: thioredoxin domain-containing protein [Verrucomicrobiaceae bacterium]|nr:MAG: thioredoxin domain-containing protein [Verrucomicrobiaceae bacterium]
MRVPRICRIPHSLPCPSSMKFRMPAGPAVPLLLLAGLILGTGACRKAKNVTTQTKAVPAVVARELESNGLGTLPGAVYHSQAGSPVHWQPWTKETLARAKDANRLIFGVIAMPQQPGFQSVLDSLAKDPELVRSINGSYVPVLIDGDASRELGLLTADLCAEIRRGLQLPLFVWMTPEGNPVAWIPVGKSASANVAELFNQSHLIVSRMWQEDSGYVMKNSALDNGARRDRLAQRKNQKVMSSQPGEDTVRGLRQLASFYDPHSRTFDEAGGLFPSGAIDLLSTAAVHPSLAPEVRSRCMETVRELMVDLLPSAMFDPLDGGVFSSRRGNSWALPAFHRDCGSQARAAVALIHAYRATGNKLALDRALQAIAYAEKSFQTPEGLYAVGLADESEASAWLWSLEDVEKALSPEDAAWWIKATGIKNMGNLPSESDPLREFFRANSMGMSVSLEEIARQQGSTVEAFAPRFEAARAALLKVREARIGQVKKDTNSHAASTFRMVSAYAAAFGVTGDEKYRTAAAELLDKAKAAFGSGPGLRLFSREAPASLGEGRAFLYGLALQAALDLSDITSDEKWLSWSEDLATTAAERFTSAEFLKECPDDAKLIDLPVTDLVMLFDDSTAGLVSFAECRLAERGRPLVRSFSELATPLPVYAVDRPILHTDLMQATLARHFPVTIVIGQGISPELKLAAERLPMRMFQRRPAKPGDNVPPGSVMVIIGDSGPHVISTAQALQEVLLPSPGKS